MRKSLNIGNWTLEIHENINNQCICFGISFNWNFQIGLEIYFGIWTICIERQQKDEAL